MRGRGDRAGVGLRIAAGAVVAFLYFPLLVIVLYAFTVQSASFTFPPPALTTHWFEVALRTPTLWAALRLSLMVALASTGIAIVLGSLLAAAVYRTKFFGREAVSFLVILPIALPGIVTGIALRSAATIAGLPFSTLTIVAGHATFCVVVVYNNVLARFRRMSGSLTEASMDLGASGLQTFRYVILPNVATALLAGGMLAFTLSFDEIVVTTFTSGQQQTLPIWIFSSLFRPRGRPVTNVAAIIVILTTFIPVLVAQILARETTGLTTAAKRR